LVGSEKKERTTAKNKRLGQRQGGREQLEAGGMM